MIQGKKVLAVICARGGSKGIPRKNIRALGGKPLIVWSIEEAKKSRFIDRLVLSSDDQEIIQVAEKFGCEAPFVRPAELAGDEVSGVDPVLHALKELPGYDYVVLLQPTSPFRTAQDIDGCIELCLEKSSPSCVSIAEAEQSPYWMFSLNEGLCLSPLFDLKSMPTRRQEAKTVYSLNGAVYVAKTDWLLKTRGFLTAETSGYLMPKERSLDLDDELDWDVAQALLARKRGGA
ncbi:MAG: acylneuraminate cytidylyltransferase family protein [Bdellovibrionota bacterium]